MLWLPFGPRLSNKKQLPSLLMIRLVRLGLGVKFPNYTGAHATLFTFGVFVPYSLIKPSETLNNRNDS